MHGTAHCSNSVSYTHLFNISRLERYLSLAWQSGAVPVIVLTKTDLVETYSEQMIKAQNCAVGANVVAVSSKSKDGLDLLGDYLKPKKTIVFLGSSGVGKSSLVNALANEEIMKTGEIRDDDSKGRHTTTTRQLLMLKNGVMIIDTPGMRELGMWNVDDGLAKTFSDIEQYLGKCRFKDCGHTSEPGCAVKEALASGKLDEERWKRYLKLRDEVRFSEDKTEYLRKKQIWHKSINKRIKQIKKNKTY